MTQNARALPISVLLLVLGAAAAVAGAAAEPAATGEPDSAAVEWPMLTATKTTLRVAVPDSFVPDITLVDNLPVFQVLEERTNVRVEWEVVYPEYDTVMLTRLAAAVELPDILRVPRPVTNAVRFGQDGLLVDVKQLIESEAPNLHALLYDMRPDVLGLITDPEGKIYFVPAVVYGLVEGQNSNDPVNPQLPVVRKDWVETLGMELPRTLDEFYGLLTAFKTQDPNGNGQADEIPLTLVSMEWGNLSWKLFSGSFGLHLARGDFYADSGGNVQYEWILPEAREWVTEMNRWWQEGLFDEGLIANSGNDPRWQGLVKGGRVGATSVNLAHLPAWTTALRNEDPDGTLWPLQVPEGSAGHSVQLAGGAYYDGFAITTASDKQDLAIRWLDYFFSDEGLTLFEFGIEGDSYEVRDGVPYYTDDFHQRALEAGNLHNTLQRLGVHTPGSPTAYTHHGRMQEVGPQFLRVYDQSLLDFISGLAEQAVPRHPNGVLPTSEEDSLLRELLPDIQTYTKEMMTKFFLGTEPLSAWDRYVSTIENRMGIDRVLEVKQAQYDRFISSSR